MLQRAIREGERAAIERRDVRVRAAATDELVVTFAAGKQVGAAIAGEHIVERVSRADDRRRNRQRSDSEIDERRAEPDSGPDAAAEQEEGRKRNAGRRPYRSGVTGWNGEYQGGLRRSEVNGGEKQYLPQGRYAPHQCHRFTPVACSHGHTCLPPPVGNGKVSGRLNFH